MLVDTDGDNLTDHFVVGSGYNNSSQEFACYDSWDSSLHWYSWQGMSQNINYGIFGFTKFSLSKTPTLINEEQKNITHKNEIKVIDILGRNLKQTNQPLLYLFNDGTLEKRIIIE